MEEKYALIRLDKLREVTGIEDVTSNFDALMGLMLRYPECVELNVPGGENEFFVLKLKDMYAARALDAYGMEVLPNDSSYGARCLDIAKRAREHPNRRRPD